MTSCWVLVGLAVDVIRPNERSDWVVFLCFC